MATSSLSKKIRTLEHRLSNRWCRLGAEGVTLTFFFVIILGPTIFVFSAVFLSWNEVVTTVFNDPIAGDIRWQIMRTALIRSFQIASIATVINIIIGLPMAILIARYKFKGKEILDTLVDLPMAVPTAALGFSIFLFWGSRSGVSVLFGLETGLLSRGPLLIILAHIAFTYPYIVRSLKAVILGIDKTYEDAAKTLGASGFTTWRTISMPLMKEGLIAGAILSFTRSLGETGATLIVAGVYETAPILIVSWRKLLLIPATAFLSMVLVTIAVIMLVLVRIMARKVGFPIEKVWPRPEQFLSGMWQRRFRNSVTIAIFLVIILLPSLFTFQYVALWWSGSPATGRFESGVFYQVFLAPDLKWAWLLISLVTSLQVATLATLINLGFGLPMAFILVRRKWGKINGILDAMIDIPLAVPSSAIGFSAFLFWRGIINPGFWLILMVHIIFTYPYFIRPVIAVIEGIDPGYEEVARTLGASDLTTFRTVSLRLTGRGILAGAIMVFTRSLGETGATIVVMGLSRTVPVYIVDLVESLALPAAAFASIILICISLTLLLILRYISRSAEEWK